jgi:hypothetical protein
MLLFRKKAQKAFGKVAPGKGFQHEFTGKNIPEVCLARALNKVFGV